MFFQMWHLVLGCVLQLQTSKAVSGGYVEYFGLSMPKCLERFCKESNCLKEIEKPIFITDYGVNCLCDRACVIYGDCCPDFYSVCLDDVNSSLPVRPGNHEWVASQVKAMTNSSVVFKFNMVMFEHKTCIVIKSGLISHHIWAIGECPESYNISSVANKCRNQTADIIGSIPATHKIYTFITFRNVFCALCHGVHLNDLEIWKAALTCKPKIEKEIITFDTLLELLNESECVFKVYFPRMIDYRFCDISDVIPTTLESVTAISTPGLNEVEINATNPNANATSVYLSSPIRVLELCNAYRYFISDMCSYYRNVHCSYPLNQLSVNVYDCTLSNCPKSGLNPYYVSLGILFSFTDQDVMMCDSATTCEGPARRECLVDEVYNYYLDQCQKLVCPVGRLPINGSCVITGSLLGDLQFQMFPRGFQVIQVNVTYNNDSCETNDKRFKEEMSFAFLTAGMETIENSALNSVMNISGYISLVLSSNCLQNGQSQISYEIYNYNYSMHFLNVLFKVINDSYKDSRSIVEATVETFSSIEVLVCDNNTQALYGNGTLENNDGSWFVYHNSLYYPLENIPFIVGVGVNDSGVSLIEYIICEMESRLLDCPMISYPENQTESQNETLHILGTDLYFSVGSFVLQEHQVYVCSNFSRSYLSNEIKFFNFNPTQGLLTLVCSIASVFSLSMNLIIYFALPDLRNIPGKIVMAVSASLLMSQTLLLLSNKPTGIFCKIFGIVMHWSWLSTFMWMTMMAVNLAKTFTAKSAALGSHRSFSFYAAIAAIVPALVVGACATVDLAEIPNMTIGYGDNDVCWIANKTALLVVFGVPLAMLLLINVVCFIITICSIERSMHISKTATSTRKDRVKCIIYSKLLIIMGLTWAFGFAAAFSNSEQLWYAFIVLNGSQGLYIFICFAFNRRVLRALKSKLSKSKHSEGFSHESRTSSTRM